MYMDNWIISSLSHWPLIACGVFYSVLCIFSLGTGLIYLQGKRQLNPLELSDSFVKKLSDGNKMEKFARFMGAVTFVVGIVQGFTAYAFFRGGSSGLYWLAIGFTLFSIASVAVKLKGKINAFPLMKLAFYLTILVILLLGSSRALFF